MDGGPVGEPLTGDEERFEGVVGWGRGDPDQDSFKVTKDRGAGGSTIEGRPLPHTCPDLSTRAGGINDFIKRLDTDEGWGEMAVDNYQHPPGSCHLTTCADRDP